MKSGQIKKFLIFVFAFLVMYGFAGLLNPASAGITPPAGASSTGCQNRVPTLIDPFCENDTPTVGELSNPFIGFARVGTILSFAGSVVWGGFKIMFAGTAEKAKEGWKFVVYALIGAGVILSLFVIMALVEMFTGADLLTIFGF